jgi:hypothetical protein
MSQAKVRNFNGAALDRLIAEAGFPSRTKFANAMVLAGCITTTSAHVSNWCNGTEPRMSFQLGIIRVLTAALGRRVMLSEMMMEYNEDAGTLRNGESRGRKRGFKKGKAKAKPAAAGV